MQDELQHKLTVYREALSILEQADDLADRGEAQRANLLYSKAAGLLLSLQEEALEVAS